MEQLAGSFLIIFVQLVSSFCVLKYSRVFEFFFNQTVSQKSLVFLYLRPLPKITWFKDGKEIREGYLINNGGMTLNIRPVTFESAGTYRCVAKNDLGSSEKEGKLIVQSELINFCLHFQLMVSIP